jgi:hypothetical protein
MWHCGIPFIEDHMTMWHSLHWGSCDSVAFPSCTKVHSNSSNAIISNYVTTENDCHKKIKQHIINIRASYNFLIAVFVNNSFYLDTINLFKLLKPTGHVMYQQHSPTLLSVHTVFMCFVFIWKEAATCATYSINWLVFITEMISVYSAVRTACLNKTVWASSLKG